jgi:hypothetical protein
MSIHPRRGPKAGSRCSSLRREAFLETCLGYRVNRLRDSLSRVLGGKIAISPDLPYRLTEHIRNDHQTNSPYRLNKLLENVKG